MAKCGECGTKFTVSEAQEQYRRAFDGDLDYDEYNDGDRCGGCAIDDAEGLMNKGRAIDMMNGEENHDAEFVQKWL